MDFAVQLQQLLLLQHQPSPPLPFTVNNANNNNNNCASATATFPRLDFSAANPAEQQHPRQQEGQGQRLLLPRCASPRFFASASTATELGHGEVHIYLLE
jgi:hypothetical protein